MDQHEESASLVGIQKDIGYIKEAMARMETNQNNFMQEVKNTYTRKDEFALVRTIVYGMVGTILTLVLTALVYLVVKL